MKTIDILKTLTPQALNNLIHHLNNDYIISDEDGKGLSSTMVENWSEECVDYLYANGYTGGKLKTSAKNFTHGNVYVLYDESKVSAEDVSKYLLLVAKRNEQN